MGQLTARRGADGGTVLAKLVRDRRISPTDLARISGLSKSTVYNLMRGACAAQPATAEAVTDGIHRLSPRATEVADLFGATSALNGMTDGRLS